MKKRNRHPLTVIILYILVLSSALVFHNRSLTPQTLTAEDRVPLQGANMLSQGAPAFLEDIEMNEPEADANTVDGDESNTEAEKDQTLRRENELDSLTPPSGKTTLSRSGQDRDKPEQAQPTEPPSPLVPEEPIHPPAQEPAEPKKPETDLQASPSVPEDSTPPVAEDSDLNPYVLDVIKTYTNGPYPYLLNTDYANYNGVTENLFYQGRTLAKAHPSGSKASHCSGITFEVFHKAMRARNRKLGLSPDDFNGMTFNDLHDFLLIWYVANGPKSTNNIAVAMEKYGVGRRITNFEDARPGDFLDFSRTNGTGHTVVFLNWVRNGNYIVGLRYWSSQGSTNGIAEKTEYFTTGGGNLRNDNVYIGRVLPIFQYRRFR